jgi:hypothetical protein
MSASWRKAAKTACSLKIGPVSAECLRQTSRLEDIYYNATDVFVTFTKQNNFPDAENLGSTTAAKIAEKSGSQSAGRICREQQLPCGNGDSGGHPVAAIPRQRSRCPRTSLQRKFQNDTIGQRLGNQ